MKNKWLKYNLSQNSHNPIEFNDIISGRKDALHDILLNNAIHDMILTAVDEDENPIFLESISKFPEFISENDEIIYANEWFLDCEQKDAKFFCIKSDWNFIEINNDTDTYDNAPSVICLKRGNKLSSKKIKMSLGKWWNVNYLIVNESKNFGITTEMIDQYPYNEIIGFDYLRSNVTLENRVEMIERKVKFKDLQYTDKINISYK